MSEHIHTREASLETARGWWYHCTDCGAYLGFEDKPPTYSIFVNGWEGEMRVWWAPEFDTAEEAMQWLKERDGEWESPPFVDEVYKY